MDTRTADREVIEKVLVRGGSAPERIILAWSSKGAYPYSDVLAA